MVTKILRTLFYSSHTKSHFAFSIYRTLKVYRLSFMASGFSLSFLENEKKMKSRPARVNAEMHWGRLMKIRKMMEEALQQIFYMKRGKNRKTKLEQIIQICIKYELYDKNSSCIYWHLNIYWPPFWPTGNDNR